MKMWKGRDFNDFLTNESLRADASALLTPCAGVCAAIGVSGARRWRHLAPLSGESSLASTGGLAGCRGVHAGAVVQAVGGGAAAGVAVGLKENIGVIYAKCKSCLPFNSFFAMVQLRPSYTN